MTQIDKRKEQQQRYIEQYTLTPEQRKKLIESKIKRLEQYIKQSKTDKSMAV
jgi:hypothetical protein